MVKKIKYLIKNNGHKPQEDGGVVSKIYYFNLMVSYLHYFNPFIGINETGKYLVATIFNSMENSYPWQNPRVRVKWSDRGPSILILDWMLVYTSSTMWMNLSPYPNLWKGEKLKSQSTLRILQKDFYSVYLTHPLCNK